jgi:probable H4MPT-linked C1 transfer pathway protein
MPGVIGLDIGGANTKGVWRDGDAVRTASRPYEVWRDRDALTGVVRAVVGGARRCSAERCALTTTAELSDAFRTKREGVAFVLDAAEAALPGDLLVLTSGRALVGVAGARARPLEVAAANWVASALAVAARHPDALVLDVGSTTADVVPVAAARSRPPAAPTSTGSWPASSSTRVRCGPTSRRSRGAFRCAAAGARSPRSGSRSAPTST